MPYDKEFYNAVTGQLKDLMGPGPGPEEGGTEVKKIPLHGKPGLDINVEVRDLLTGLAGKGHNLSNDDRSAMYSRLGVLLDDATARKLLTHVAMFNDRPDLKDKNAEQRIEEFYNLPSNDPEVNKILQRSRSLGYGPEEGMRTSPELTNQELSGRVKTDEKGAGTETKKIKDIAATSTN